MSAGAAPRLLEQLRETAGVDHHAHLLVGDDGAFALGDDAAPLYELVLESPEPDRARDHVRAHPSHARAMRDLAEMATRIAGVERSGTREVRITDDDPIRLFRSFVTVVLLTRAIVE